VLFVQLPLERLRIGLDTTIELRTGDARHEERARNRDPCPRDLR
jgi:hypothetical protein